MSQGEASHDLFPRLGSRIWGGAILVCVLGGLLRGDLDVALV